MGSGAGIEDWCRTFRPQRAGVSGHAWASPAHPLVPSQASCPCVPIHWPGDACSCRLMPLVQASQVPAFSDTPGYFRFPPLFHSHTGYLALRRDLMGRSAASGKRGGNGIGEHGHLVGFFSLFSPSIPPVFRHFSDTCRVCSYNCYSDLMVSPHFPPIFPFPPISPPFPPHFPPFPPISPPFPPHFPPISPFFQRRLRGLGDFGFGYRGALLVEPWGFLTTGLRGAMKGY